MELAYYGVRGSIPTPGKETAKYGGNTSCVLIRAGDQLIVCDAGSGMRKLGNDLLKEGFAGNGELSLLVSHTHWDHIQGLPFFVPAYIKGNKLSIYGERKLGVSIEDAIKQQQSPPYFPEDAKFNADMTYLNTCPGSRFEIGSIKVSCARLSHPNGVLAYRMEHDGKTIVYATDNEHHSSLDSRLLDLAREADILIYDAQYTPKEYPSKVGWGHSTYEEGVKIAKAANVKSLHLFHHDPSHSDEMIDEIVMEAKKGFENTIAAREGLEAKV